MPGNKVIVKEIEIKNGLYYKSTPILKYSINFPQFTSLNSRWFIGRLNRYYQNKARSYIQYCNNELYKQAISYFKEAEKENYPFHEYEFQVTCTISYNQGCILSLYFDEGRYTGGANGTSFRSSDTWDLSKPGRLELKELYPYNRNYISDIKNEIIRQILEQIEKGDGNYFEGYPKLVEQYFELTNFYLEPNAIIIYFQEITIAPHSSGTVTFELKQP